MSDSRLYPSLGSGDLAEVTRQIARIPLESPMNRRWAAAFAVALALLGVFLVSVVYLFYEGVGIWGLNTPVFWGMAIMNYVWWIGIGNAGTLISALLLTLEQPWRNSLNRFAESMTVFAVICAAIYPVIHLGRPGFLQFLFIYPDSMGLWPQFKSPLFWDFAANLIYLIVSVVFWYIGLIPDLATLRDRAKWRPAQVFYGLLCLGWRGSAVHWARWQQAYRIGAILAVPLVVSVHSGVGLLFAVSAEPGWHTTIFPVLFVFGAVFSGFAVVSILAISLRTAFGLEALVTERHLDILGKMLLLTGLMTGFGYLMDAFTSWYGGDPFELRTLTNRFVGGYAWAYWGTIFCNVVLIQALWFEKVRRSPLYLFLVALGAAVGMWFERFMLVATSLYRDFLVSSWHFYVPSLWDWLTYAGTFGLFLFLFLLFIRLLPAISMFEVKEVMAVEAREEEAVR